MLWLLMTTFAHADCEQQAESTTVWPSDQTVGTDVLIDLTQRFNPSRVVELRNVGTDELTPTERFVSRSCIDWDYDCGARFRPSVPLAPDSEWDVLIDGIPIARFTTGDGPRWLTPPSPPRLQRGAITDSPQNADYSGYTATWPTSPLLDGEWLEYEVRGEGVVAPGDVSPVPSITLGWAYCGGGVPAGDLIHAEVRARRIGPSGLRSEWSDWTDVNPSLTEVIVDPNEPPGRFESSCSTAPPHLTWLGLPLLLLFRRRR